MSQLDHGTPAHGPKRPLQLSRNEDGAIMVIGVFIAILLVGLLYYISGIGQTLFHRERMQDAADAVALATAVGHARGMNLLAFINMVMAALVAILLALKVIELLLTGLALILTAISWFVPPAAAAVPIVNSARMTTKEVHDTARPIVDNILIGMNAVERAIRVITPSQSVFTGAIKVQEKYPDVIDLAIGVPPRLTLPVENDEYNTLCNEAEEILGGLIKSVTGKVPFIGKVLGIVSGGLVKAVKHAFCYKDGTAPPEAPIDIDRNLPIDAEPGLACETDQTNMDPASENCRNWESELRDRHPDADGGCGAPGGGRNSREDTNAAPGSTQVRMVCESALHTARDQCNINMNGKRENYSWSTQKVEERVVFDPLEWKWRTEEFNYIGEPELKNTSTFSEADTTFTNTQAEAQAGFRPNFEQIERDAPPRVPGKPCDYRGRGVRSNRYAQEPEPLWSDWNAQVYSEEAPRHVMPVCSQRLHARKEALPFEGEVPRGKPGDPLPEGFNSEGYWLRYDTVKHVYGCTQPDTIKLKFPDSWVSESTGQNGDDKAPQKMEEGATLGSDDFQIRGVAMALDGDRRPARAERALRVSAFNRAIEPESWVSFARAAGRVGVAQAEYYFNHNGVDLKDPYEWMWHMDWRARLVRFRLPSGDEERGPNDESDMGEINSLTTNDDVGINMDISSVPLPEGAPDLGVLEQLIVH